MSEHYDGKVAKVFSSTQVVINLGSEDGVKKDDFFMIFVYGDEVCDPDTGENLGNLEIVKGRGRATHVQPRITTIETSERVRSTKVIKRKPSAWSGIGALMSELSGSEEIIEEGPPKEFYDVQKGDLVRKTSG